MRLPDRRRRAATHKPRVATIEWLEPLMTAGNWMPELVEMAGGINLFGRAGEHSPWLQREELQYFNRPGPRLVESLQMLAEVLHPELFSFGLEGKAWERLR